MPLLPACRDPLPAVLSRGPDRGRAARPAASPSRWSPLAGPRARRPLDRSCPLLVPWPEAQAGTETRAIHRGLRPRSQSRRCLALNPRRSRSARARGKAPVGSPAHPNDRVGQSFPVCATQAGWTSGPEGTALSSGASWLSRGRSRDRSGAEYDVAVIEHGSLAPRDAPGRAVQLDPQRLSLQPAGGREGLAVRPKLHRDIVDRAGRRRTTAPNRPDGGDL